MQGCDPGVADGRLSVRAAGQRASRDTRRRNTVKVDEGHSEIAVDGVNVTARRRRMRYATGREVGAGKGSEYGLGSFWERLY